MANALVEFNKGCAIEMLKRFGFDGDRLRKELGGNVEGEPCRILIPIAQEEMRAMQHRFLGTEHLLLAVLRVGNNRLAEFLMKEGMTVAMAREEILKELDPNFGQAEAG